MIIMGRIVAPYGVKGWVRVHPFGDDPMDWRKMKTWWLSAQADAPGAAWQAHLLKAMRPHASAWVASFEGIDTREGAEALAGFYIAAPREELPTPAENEYYWGDLLGMTVENTAGLPLGVVSSLLETGAHAVLEVKDATQPTIAPRLIPFVEAFVKTVDAENRRVVVDWDAVW